MEEETTWEKSWEEEEGGGKSPLGVTTNSSGCDH